ncbi:hypothetical protein [Williamsia phyllosphaerae]|uniref:hypothetical protein n=1 Tax=Williamsia phyllosphaerae TaxID=885042 RepID=UPI00166CC411|nr:hypothetical protein [Williamsia phyllosphaerae]
MSEQRRSSSRLVFDPQSGLSIDLAELQRHTVIEPATDPQGDSSASDELHADT